MKPNEIHLNIDELTLPSSAKGVSQLTAQLAERLRDESRIPVADATCKTIVDKIQNHTGLNSRVFLE